MIEGRGYKDWIKNPKNTKVGIRNKSQRQRPTFGNLLWYISGWTGPIISLRLSLDVSWAQRITKK